MFGRVLTLYLRLEKRTELERKMDKEIIPVIKRSVGLLEILVLQDEIELDKLLIVSLWQTREDAERCHVAFFDKFKSVMEPYITFPPVFRTYKVEDGFPWVPSAHRLSPETFRDPKQ